jgi:hypothetical protein
MKNLHLRPTDNYSPLVHSTSKYGGYFLSKYYSPMKHMGDSFQHIYITSDEDIKKGDWIYGLFNGGVILRSELNIPKHTQYYLEFGLKIILTTDQDLIADGVQAIDDEFLEWYVKNPSCEEVEVDLFPKNSNKLYEIIIPQEVPKQKTLEKAAKKYRLSTVNKMGIEEVAFLKGAKWQEERMYSDMEEYSAFVLKSYKEGLPLLLAKEWFEQFKNKGGGK